MSYKSHIGYFAEISHPRYLLLWDKWNNLLRWSWDTTTCCIISVSYKFFFLISLTWVKKLEVDHFISEKTHKSIVIWFLYEIVLCLSLVWLLLFRCEWYHSWLNNGTRVEVWRGVRLASCAESLLARVFR